MSNPLELGAAKANLDEVLDRLGLERRSFYLALAQGILGLRASTFTPRSDLVSSAVDRSRSLHAIARDLLENAPLIRSSSPFALLPITTLAPEAVARHAGASSSAVTSQLAAGKVSGAHIGGHTRVYGWQLPLLGTEPLRQALAQVLQAVDGRFDGETLERIMTTPQPALIAEASQPIINWLHYGRPLAPALEVIRGGGN